MHAVSTHLTRSMSTQEDHVLQTIHADRTARLQQTTTHDSYSRLLTGSRVKQLRRDTSDDDRNETQLCANITVDEIQQ